MLTTWTLNKACSNVDFVSLAIAVQGDSHKELLLCICTLWIGILRYIMNHLVCQIDHWCSCLLWCWWQCMLCCLLKTLGWVTSINLVKNIRNIHVFGKMATVLAILFGWKILPVVETLILYASCPPTSKKKTSHPCSERWVNHRLHFITILELGRSLVLW